MEGKHNAEMRESVRRESGGRPSRQHAARRRAVRWKQLGLLDKHLRMPVWPGPVSLGTGVGDGVGVVAVGPLRPLYT